MAGPAENKYTAEEYLVRERASETKHEYYRGRIYAMASASLIHNRICFNLNVTLGPQLKGGDCRGLGSDMRVRVPATGLYTYPDAVVVCGEPVLEDSVKDTLLNPKVIFEVLSPSTERYDRGEKFIHFQSVATLTDYILISQDRRRIEHFHRIDGGNWVLAPYGIPGQSVEISSIGCSLSLDELYDEVDLPTQPELREESLQPR